MEDVSFYSPDDLDKRLLGEVSPPDPLDSLSNKWKFKDANWGGDTMSNTKDIIWFIDKTLDLNIDGVVYINDPISDKNTFEQRIKTFLELSPSEKTIRLGNLIQNKDKPFLVVMEKADELETFNKLGLSGFMLIIIVKTVFRFYGVIESDLEENGYNVSERKVNLSISLEGNLVKKKLSLSLKRKNRKKIRIKYI
jgi:hypothetical protein